MIEGGAKQRGFCTVRIDLDESDVETQLIFFEKLFDGILTAACKENAFGGIQGKTYDTYRSMIDAYETPEDKTFCPFIFPLQYAKAMDKENNSAPVNGTGFKDDISQIQTEIAKPIAILFDECDVLTKSKVHLQKLRNIFMNTTGFFIVLTGTGAFFPLINDVFSPIIRQFKTINVKPYDSEKETKDCIEKPLKGLGIRTQEIFDFETYTEIDAIHNLSGGRPYEIQLICHQLFKRVQEGKASKIQLSVDVLDDILNELQSLQDVAVRPVVQQIKSLDKDELSALGTLLTSNKLADFEQAWFFEYVFNEKSNWTKDSLREKLDILISKGLIKADTGGLLSFTGDDFDRIYCKYYCRKQKINTNINDISFDTRLRMKIDFQIRKDLKRVDMDHPRDAYTYEDDDIEAMIGDFGKQKFDFFDSYPKLAEALYRANLENQDLPNFPFILLKLSTPWNKLQAWYTIEDMQPDYDSLACSNDFEKAFKKIKERALENNSDLTIKVFTTSITPIDTIANKVLVITNQKLRSRLAKIHTSEMIECYTEIQDREGARYHGNLAFQFFPEPEDIQSANNLGYLFMSLGEIEKSKRLFEAAQLRNKTFPFETLGLFPDDLNDFWSGIVGLVNYNLGIVYAMQEDYEKAKELINKSILEAEKQKDQVCECLFAPSIAEKQLVFTEVIEPNLLLTAKSSLEIIDDFLRL